MGLLGHEEGPAPAVAPQVVAGEPAFGVLVMITKPELDVRGPVGLPVASDLTAKVVSRCGCQSVVPIQFQRHISRPDGLP